MKLVDVRTFQGPNVFHYKPVLRGTLALEDLTEVASDEIPGFTERLQKILPGIQSHHCSEGHEGGFIERLKRGTYFAHITEHVALELTVLAQIPASFGKTVYAGEQGLYHIALRFEAEEATKFLLEVAVKLVEAVVKNSSFHLEEYLQRAQKIAAETELGPSTKAIVAAAEKRGIPWSRLDNNSLVQLGYGCYRKFVEATQADSTKAIAVDIACDKDLTKTLLARAEIPVPKGKVARSVEEVLEAFSTMQGAVTVKPLNGNQGKLVFLNLRTEEEVVQAFEQAAVRDGQVIIEEFFVGRDYRVLVIGGKVVAASERIPAHVIGDGTQSIRELINEANSDERRGEGHEKPLTTIKITSNLEEFLQKSGYSLDTIPSLEEKVFLCATANLSTGGIAIDVTDSIHQQVSLLCERAAQTIGLDICGIDLITPDISKPVPEWGAGIIELNAAPGIRMHHFPTEGKPREVGEAIVEMMYPKGSPSRIPLITITGTNGKTSVTRMISHVIAESGKTVGMTTTDGIYIGGKCILEGDTTGAQSARTVLFDPSVEAAVLEVARGGILRKGLGYDWADIGIMLNIQPDHFGQDGIEDIEDLLHIKSLVAERVREGGTVILNADDPLLAKLPESRRMTSVERNYIYFSTSGDNPVILQHLAKGGTAYFVRQGKIVEAKGVRIKNSVHYDQIPCVYRGAAPFFLENLMASLAACRTYGLSWDECIEYVATFDHMTNNPGRMNIYEVEQGYVVLDYGHNPSAVQSVAAMAKILDATRRIGIITVPGDRSDDLVEEMARVAASTFDRVIVREDDDRRGRASGDLACKLCGAIKEERQQSECQIILNEREALTAALESMVEGEVVFLFYEDLSQAQKVLEEAGARIISLETLDSIQPELWTDFSESLSFSALAQ